MAEQEWVDVGAAVELAQRAVQPVTLGRTRIALTHRDGEFGAISGVCNHVGGPLGQGTLEGDYVTCPWHYWRFRLKDGAWADNPRIKIGSYPVHVVDDEIRLELPELPVESTQCPDRDRCSPAPVT